MEIRAWRFQNYRDCGYTCNPHKFEIPALRFPRKDPVNPCKHLQCTGDHSKYRAKQEHPVVNFAIFKNYKFWNLAKNEYIWREIFRITIWKIVISDRDFFAIIKKGFSLYYILHTLSTIFYIFWYSVCYKKLTGLMECQSFFVEGIRFSLSLICQSGLPEKFLLVSQIHDFLKGSIHVWHQMFWGIFDLPTLISVRLWNFEDDGS